MGTGRLLPIRNELRAIVRHRHRLHPRYVGVGHHFPCHAMKEHKVPIEPIDVVEELTKHPGGRPSEYEPVHLQMVDDYLHLYREGEDAEVVPTMEGLAFFMQRTKSTLLRWAEEHEEFRYALDRLKDIQAMKLQNGGLKGEFAPVITKLMLSANHGMAEKQETKNEESGTLTVKVLRFSADGDRPAA